VLFKDTGPQKLTVALIYGDATAAPAPRYFRGTQAFGANFAVRYASQVFWPAPRPRLERGTYCLGGTPVEVADGAWRCLTCRLGLLGPAHFGTCLLVLGRRSVGDARSTTLQAVS
jgi:hypothetical protein